MEHGFSRLRKKPVLDALLWTLSVSLLGANIVLLGQNRKLQGAVASRNDWSPQLEAGKHLGRYLAAVTMGSTVGRSPSHRPIQSAHS